MTKLYIFLKILLFYIGRIMKEQGNLFKIGTSILEKALLKA
jgi:hypothetical protein